MNAIELIKQDHREVERLFEAFEQSDDSEQKREIVDQVIHELSVHAAIEEQIFYPSVREALAAGDSLVDESLHEHGEAKQLLNELDGMAPDHPSFDPTMTELIRDVRHHVEEEENEILPGLEQRLDQQLLDDMGNELEQAKGRAPTRPHPMAPDTPPANKLTGPAAGLVDRIRDAVQDRSS